MLGSEGSVEHLLMYGKSMFNCPFIDRQFVWKYLEKCDFLVAMAEWRHFEKAAYRANMITK